MSEVRLAVIGCGVIGRHHIEVVQDLEGCRLVALCDADEAAVKKAAEEHGVPRWSTDAGEVFRNPDVDGVILALPTSIRTGLGLEALRHGKHVLLEKPVAMNSDEVRSLMAARGDRVVACCSSRMSLFPSALRAREWIREGHLGEIRSIRCRAVQAAGAKPEITPPAWRLKKDANGGGILVNWGPYDLDLLFSLCDWKLVPQMVLARSWEVPPPLSHHVHPESDAETHVSAMMLCDGGVAFHYERAESFCGPSSEAWEVVGSEGAIRINLHDPSEPVYFDHLDPNTGLVPEVLHHDPDCGTCAHPNPVRDFVCSILDGTPPHTGLEESLQLTRVTDAIYQSAESGAPVKLGAP